MTQQRNEDADEVMMSLTGNGAAVRRGRQVFERTSLYDEDEHGARRFVSFHWAPKDDPEQ